MSPKIAFRFVLVSFVFTIVLSPTPAAAQISSEKSQITSRIVLPIDESVRVTIPQSTHPMAKPALDIGALNGTTELKRMILVLGGSPDQEYQARTLLDSQHTGGSPDFHHWLTPEEFGQKFGPSPQDIGQVTGWLQQHGFTIGGVAKSGRWIEFSGTSEQVEETFQTRMRQYLVQGELHVANATDISIPAALSGVVRGVLSLHNFFSRPMLQRSLHKTPITLERGKPNVNFTDGSHAVTPGDLANIYNLNPLYNGTTPLGTVNGSGQTIAIVADSNINTTATTGIDDVALFQKAFGLPVHDPNIILNGPDPGINPDAFEASLDVEYSGAIAPGAVIDLVVTGGNVGDIISGSDPIALGASFIVDQNLAPIMNVSFGNCEQALGSSGSAFWNALWQQAAAQGISVFVASGDTGAAGCDPNIAPSPSVAQGGLGVNGFGSTAFNTAVGGTEFNETVNGGVPATFWSPVNGNNLASAIGYIPEMVWNESCTPSTAGSFCQQNNIILLFGGTGGISTEWAVPSYQTLNIQGLAGVGFPKRPVPDVALDAAVNHDPYVVCFTSDSAQPDCTGGKFQNLAGGTSFASPDFAGIMALVNQVAQNPAAGNRQGLANYVLYTLAANESQGAGGFGGCNSSNQTNPLVRPGSQCVLNDVTAGNNGVPGNDTLTGGAFIPAGDQSGQTGYNATTGYDPAIGLGSVNATTLVTDWVGASKNFKASATTLTSPSGTTFSVMHGASVSFTSTVTNQAGAGHTPAGAISIVAQGGNLPSSVGVAFAPLNGSGATATTNAFSTNSLPGGTGYSLFANFPGDGVVAGSTSGPPLTVTVQPENSSTTLRSFLVNVNTGQVTQGVTTVGFGDPVNVLLIDGDTAGLSGLIPSIGSVSFTDNSNALTQISINNSGISEFADCFSVANCLTVGTHTITGTYSGDGLSYNASPASAPITITVTKGTPIALLLPSVKTAGTGVPFTVSVLMEVSGAVSPTGTVQFLDGGTPLGSPLTLSGGVASTQVALNSGGTHNLTAQYSGDSNFNAATSQVAQVNIVAPFNFTATSASQTIAAGQTATYNVTLNSAGGFTGQVNFNCTGAPGGSTCTVSPNPANLTSTTTSVALTVTVSNTANARLNPIPLKGLPFVFAGILAAGLVGLRRRTKERILLCLGMFVIAGVVACGNPTPKPPTNATLTVTGTSGSTTSQIVLSLTITH